MAEKTFNPAKYLVLSFALAVLAGAILLYLPLSSAPGRETTLLDALFTATSAVCVTGLIVVDTGSHFSAFGQAVILVLIQLGGLGIMTFSVFVGLVLGRGLGIWQRQVLQDSLGNGYSGRVSGLVWRIVSMVFIVEAVGSALMFLHWHGVAESFRQALWLSVFHSVSAFCNAGFSLFSDSLMSFRGDTYINVVFMILIILGGLGFVAIFELLGLVRKRRQAHVLSLHTKMVLTMTGFLILAGAVMIYLIESRGILSDAGFGEGVLAAFFQSVTARTAGFNTVNTGGLSNAALMLITMLMFVGASPGSTGGGVKTTTAMVFLVDLKSYLRGREPEVMERSIDRMIVEKAHIVLVMSMGLVTVSAFMLMLFEPAADAMRLFFEAMSAFGTVGLSTGITPGLSVAGKAVIIITMFAGRVGPLTLVLALAGREKRGYYEFPEGKVFIG